MDKVILKAQNITFAYPKKENSVLRHVTVNFEVGKCTGILGPNGTGKSTLLKCLNRIYEPSEGQIVLGNTPLDKFSRKEIAKQIAYVPQYTNSDVSMTVFDTVLLGRLPYAGYSYGTKDKELAYEIIREMELELFLGKDVRHLSGGERQRVFIARALVGNPKVVLLDEPTSSLDVKHQLHVMEQLQRLARTKNIAVILTIHDLNLAAMYCDHIIMIKEQSVLAEGAPMEALTTEHIESLYGVQTKVYEEFDVPFVRLLKQNGEQDSR